MESSLHLSPATHGLHSRACFAHLSGAAVPGMTSPGQTFTSRSCKQSNQVSAEPSPNVNWNDGFVVTTTMLVATDLQSSSIWIDTGPLKPKSKCRHGYPQPDREGCCRWVLHRSGVWGGGDLQTSACELVNQDQSRQKVYSLTLCALSNHFIGFTIR